MVEDTHTSRPPSPAETLRRAAALMRERAQAAHAGPWVPNGPRVDQFMIQAVAECYGCHPDAAHIASWHPVVALAVANWLDGTAADMAAGMQYLPPTEALAVARAYLGESA